MKKLLSLLLVLAMSIACLSACNNETATTEQTNTPAAEQGPTAAEEAKDLLFAMYRDSDKKATPSDYKVVSAVKVGDTLYDVVWTTDSASVKVGTPDEKKMVIIDVDEKTTTEINYVLTGTITDKDGNKASISLSHNVPAYKVFTYDEYVKAENGTTVVVRGVITAFLAKSRGNSSNSIYFQDKDGGYYAYNLADDPIVDLGLKEGMTIEVAGTRDTYSGTYEIVSAAVEVLDSNIKTVEPEDFTQLLANASSLKDEKLTYRQSIVVTVKGVEISDQDLSSGYYNFLLGDKKTYIRISSSSCPILKEDQTTMINNHTEHKGYIADATGLLTLYDGAFYISPLTKDAFSNFTLPQKSDDEMVAFEAEGLGIPAKVQEDTTVALHANGTTYTDVAITYAVEGTAGSIADGVLTLTQGENDAEVKVTATLSVNGVSTTKEVVIKVEAKASDLCEAEVIAKAFALEQGETLAGTQVLRGTVTEIVTPFDEKYGNTTVNMQVGDKIVQVFRVVGGSDIAVGDVITVTGILKNYKGTVEFDAKCTYSKELSVEEAKQLLVVEKAFALEQGAVLPGTQVLCGTVTEIVTPFDEKYGNTTVNMQIGDKIVQVFRVVGGSDIAVGDVITVTGTLKNYKGTVEFDAKCTYVKGQKLAEAKDILVMDKAYALEQGGVLAGTQELIGTVTEIVTPYDEKYGNTTVNMMVGDRIIQVFRVVGGQDIAVGDVITVTGIIKNYKGTVEFDAKCTYTK